MNLLENGQSAGNRFELTDETSFVLAARVQALHGVQMWGVEVSVKLQNMSMFMSKHAGRAILAGIVFVEGAAVVSLELVAVAQNSVVGKLLLRVGKPARILEAALGRLDPVAAELGLLEAVGHWHQRARHLVVVRVEVVLIGDTLGAAIALAFLRAALEHVCVREVGWDEIASRHLECSLGEGH